jgi:exopolysaccharide biosynthesis polyprenyl glycosylphosphotransferase
MSLTHGGALDRRYPVDTRHPDDAIQSPHTTPTADAPLRRWIRRAATGDLCAAMAAVLLAGLIRFGPTAPGRLTAPYAVLAAAVVVGWPVLGAICGVYELRPSLFGVEELRRVLKAGLLLAANLGMAHFLFKLDLSRGFVAALIPLVVVLTGAWRAVLRWRTSNWMARGRYHHRAVAMGSAAEIAELRRHMIQGVRNAPTPIELVAFVADDLDETDPVPPGLEGLRRLPTRDAVNTFAQRTAVDLLVRAGRPQANEMAAMTQRASDIGAWVAIAPHRQDTTANVAVSYIPLGATPLLIVETPGMRPSAAFLKAALDRVMALGFLVVLSPFLVAIATTIKVRDGGPILFRQQRVGLGGQQFTCLKFRTMHEGAEDALSALFDDNEHDGPLFKMRNDPRITSTGRWLRKHSFDELPQLVNVLRGDMSIVGPRPALPSEVETFDIRTRRRLLVKPGLTGLWQVEGRADLPWDEGVYLDLLYVDHWSPLLDWVIIARTVRTVVRPSGAY